MRKEATVRRDESCVDPGGGCGFFATERNRYFTGKFMAPRDFEADQLYFVSHERLHNRLLHGWGIVCGLRVVEHPNEDCRDRWVVVKSGVAIDCCGRVLVLRKDKAFELPLPRPSDDTGEQTAQTSEQEPATGPFLVCLRYREEQIEYVPALYAEAGCDPKRHEANRIRECAVVEVCSLDDVEPGCWRSRGGSMDTPCRDDCDEDVPGPGGVCLEPSCPCGHAVPLALIRFDPDAPDDRFTIEEDGRRRLPPPADLLTHVAGISWPHGGEVSIDELRDQDGRLEVRFDRPLQEADGDATGIGPYTFYAMYGGIQHDLEYLAFDEDEPPALKPDRCTAFLKLENGQLSGRDTIAGSSVYVTLECDFIPDCHGIPVSGPHLNGELPSGNGTPGGRFTSWFRVVSGDGRRES
jgi:hypothetical protein